MPFRIIRNLLAMGLLLVPVFAPAAQAAADRPVLLAQNSATLPIAGIYSGNVNRSVINGQAEATRIYRVRLNDDMTTGTIDVYELNNQFVAHLGFAGSFSGLVFVGKTVVLNAPVNYIPDDLRLTFAADHQSLQWYHNDGRMQGSGILSHLNN